MSTLITYWLCAVTMVAVAVLLYASLRAERSWAVWDGAERAADRLDGVVRTRTDRRALQVEYEHWSRTALVSQVTATVSCLLIIVISLASR